MSHVICTHRSGAATSGGEPKKQRRDSQRQSSQWAQGAAHTGALQVYVCVYVLYITYCIITYHISHIAQLTIIYSSCCLIIPSMKLTKTCGCNTRHVAATQDMLLQHKTCGCNTSMKLTKTCGCNTRHVAATQDMLLQHKTCCCNTRHVAATQDMLLQHKYEAD